MNPKTDRAADSSVKSADAADKAVTDIVTDQVSVLQEEAKVQSQAALDKLQTQAETTFDKSRLEIAEQIALVSKALRGGSEELKEHSLGTFAVYSEQIAERIEDVSTYLRDRDRNAMRRDFEQTLERDPVLVLGGLAALGAAGMWYLKRRQRGLPKSSRAATGTSLTPSQKRGL